MSRPTSDMGEDFGVARHFRSSDPLQRLEAAVAEVLDWHDPRGEPLEALRAAWEEYRKRGSDGLEG